MISAIFLAYTCRRHETAKHVPAREHALTAVQYVAILILMVIVFARAFQDHGIQFADGHMVPSMDVGTHLYFSMTTWTTMGLGDFKPTPDSRAWAAVEGLCGYVFLGLFLVILPSLLGPRQSAGEEEPDP